MSNSIFSRFLAGAISLGFSQLSLAIFGLISITIAVRYIPPEEYGAFVLLQVILTFLTEFTSFGLSLTIPQSIASSADPLFKRRVINTAIYFRLLTAVSVAILILVIRFVLNRYSGPSIWSDLLLYLPLLLGLAGLVSTFEAILQGFFKFKLIGISGIVGSLVNCFLSVVFIVHLRLGIFGLIYAKLISVAMQMLIAGVYANIEYKWEFNKKTLWEMLCFGFPLQLQFILDFVYSRLDTIILASMLGTAGTAYYEIARKIPEGLKQLFGVFRRVYFPMIAELNARKQHEKAFQMLNAAVRGLSFISLLGAIISVTFGKDIILLLFSERYTVAYPLFVLLMLGLSLNILENTLGYTLVAIGESDKPLYVNIARSAISAAGNLLMIPIIGIAGAPIVNLLSNIIATPMDMMFLARKSYVVQVRHYMKGIIIFGTSSAIFYLFSSPAYSINLGIIALFIISCSMLSIITKEDFCTTIDEIKTKVFKRKKNSMGYVGS